MFYNCPYNAYVQVKVHFSARLKGNKTRLSRTFIQLHLAFLHDWALSSKLWRKKRSSKNTNEDGKGSGSKVFLKAIWLELSAASHAFSHSFQLLRCFIENGLGFLRFNEVKISFRSAPHNSPRLVLWTWGRNTKQRIWSRINKTTPLFPMDLSSIRLLIAKFICNVMKSKHPSGSHVEQN